MHRVICFCVLLATAGPARAEAVAHLGLLSAAEMAEVYANARSTQALFLKGQHLSACWPYDAGRDGALTGLAFCKIETPRMQDRFVTIQRGPDLYCSYLRSDYCEITPTDWLK